MTLSFPMMPGLEVNLLLILLLSFSIGTISGFAGVGGGFLMTPALIILGFPAQFAVGTSLIWVMANSVVGALRHRQHGNVDVKLGLLIAAASMAGVEIGVRILSWVLAKGLAEETILILAIFILLSIGGYTFLDTLKSLRPASGSYTPAAQPDKDAKTSALAAVCHRIKIKPLIHFAGADITISLWPILALGLCTGVLSGVLGVGGGFIMVPSLIFLVGVPSFLAVGTDLFQIIFSSAYGAIRYTMGGEVIIYAAFVMILSSAIGVQCGVQATRLLQGICMRLVLAFSIFIAVLGSTFQLFAALTGNTNSMLNSLKMAVTFGGLGWILIVIFSMAAAAIRFNRGRYVPAWLSKWVVENSD